MSEIPWRKSTGDYNFSRFRFAELLGDALHTLKRDGVMPGELAPSFELQRIGGGTVRLEQLRGRPVLLRFGSFT